MTQHAFVVLMYHELERPGQPTCEASPAYRRYVVRETEFREQLACLTRLGLRGSGLSAALASETVTPGLVGITFDDGCMTDRSIAAVELQAAGFGATFFVVSGFVGRPGYLTRAQVRELGDAGFEIGSHSRQHDFLTSLSPQALRDDLAGSKAELEEITGRPVAALSCPGGRWNRQVAAAARDAGFSSVSTSRVAVNSAVPARDRIARLAIRRGMPLARFRQWCTGNGLAGERARASALIVARALLGSVLYHRLHGRLA